MNPDASQNTRPPESVSAKTIGAEMLTSLVLLSGTWGLEWVKSRFEHGVPALTAASVTFGELTVFLYFLRSFVRAVAWAIREIREALSTAGFENFFGRLNKTFKKALALLGEAIPSAEQVQSAWQLLIPILAVGLVVLLGWLVVLLVSGRGRSSVTILEAQPVKLAIPAPTAAPTTNANKAELLQSKEAGYPESEKSSRGISPERYQLRTPPGEGTYNKRIARDLERMQLNPKPTASPTPEANQIEQGRLEEEQLRLLKETVARAQKTSSRQVFERDRVYPSLASPMPDSSPPTPVMKAVVSPINSIYTKLAFVPRVGSLLVGIMFFVFISARALRAFSLT